MTEKSNQGFASMERKRQREMASKGGRTAHEQHVAHEWTSEEAREAGRKGGIAAARKKAERAAAAAAAVPAEPLA